MKIAILSDTHFGDNTCTLVERKKTEPSNFKKGCKFSSFQRAVGTKNDYLIMAGDIFDFSITSYEEAYEYAQAFFTYVKKKDIAEQIIYLPGNHDADMWHIMQHQRAVINRLQRGDSPKGFEHSTPGILYDKSDGGEANGFWLHGVTPCFEEGKSKYGRMFLDKITGTTDTESTTFNFAYPNLYIVTDEETVLVTHGQYMEQAWSFLGELVMEITDGDLDIGLMDIEEMMELNFPINQLLCTGVGQAGVLTEKLVRVLELDVKNKNFTKVDKYLNNIEKLIDKKIVSEGWFGWGWLQEQISDKCISVIKEKIIEAIHTIEQSRDNENFFLKKDKKDRYNKYYAAEETPVETVELK